MIGIHSISTCYNYGALLQCWSLQQAINEYTKQSPVHFEICTKKSSIITRIKYVINVMLGRSYKYPEPIEGRYRAAQIFKENLLTTISFDSYEDIMNSKIDSIIIGSDEVLNPSKHTTMLMRGVLPEKLSKTISGYALSIGNEDRIDSCIDAGFNPYGFRNVGVRDSVTSTLFKKFDRSSTLNLDPVFLPSIDAFEKIGGSFVEDVSLDNILSSEYILVYSDMDSSELCPYLKSKYSTKKFVILGNLESKIEKKKNVKSDMFEFLPCDFPIHRIPQIISCSSGVITNFFHGIVLSLRFNRPFNFINNEMKNYKVFDLLARIGYANLEDQESFPDLFDVNKWKTIYFSLNERIEQERKKSINFLKKIVEDSV